MAAFALLIKRHGQAVWRSVAALTGRPEDAEDHVQTAFIKAYERIGDFRGESRFSTWLTRIAINEALQQLRRDQKLASLEPEDESIWDRRSANPRPAQRWCQDPESNYSRAECQELVGRELAALPAAYRLPVVLRDLQGLSGEETAQILGLPLATTKTRLLRGRAMLREALTPYFALPKERPLA
jgi:RNA polymerase sigma-70 factor (ECF subfamily)